MGHEMGDAYIRSFADQLRLAVPEANLPEEMGEMNLSPFSKIQKAVRSITVSIS